MDHSKVYRYFSWNKLYILIVLIIFTISLPGFFSYCLKKIGITGLSDRILIIETTGLIILTFLLVLFAYVPVWKELSESRYNDMIRKGYIFLNLKKYEAAEYCFKTAKDYMPEIPETYYGWGNLLDELKRYEEAKKAFEDAIEKKGNYWEAHYGLACILFKLGDLIEAKKKFKGVIKQIEKFQKDAKQKKEPKDDLNQKLNFSDVYRGFGNVLGQLGSKAAEKQDKEKARKFFKNSKKYYYMAKKLNPNYAEAYFGLGNILANLAKLESDKEEKYKKAMEQYENAIKYMLSYSEAYYGMANVLAEIGKIYVEKFREKGDKGDKEMAIEYYEDSADAYGRAIRLKDDFEDAYFGLGNVMAELAKYENEEESITKYEEARNNYEKAIQYKFKFPDAYNRLGNVLKQLGKKKKEESNSGEAIKIYKKAIRAYRTAIKQKPDYQEAKDNLEIAERELDELTTRNP